MVLFRATSFENMWQVFHRMFVPAGGLHPAVPPSGLLLTYALVGICHCLAYQAWFKRWMIHMPGQAIGVGYCTVLLAALLFAPRGGQLFIYFQF
jgi:hypothetical protein